MDNQYKNNAKEAINILKAEIASEIAYYSNMKHDKIDDISNNIKE
jgi:hypothetical protein